MEENHVKDKKNYSSIGEKKQISWIKHANVMKKCFLIILIMMNVYFVKGYGKKMKYLKIVKNAKKNIATIAKKDMKNIKTAMKKVMEKNCKSL